MSGFNPKWIVGKIVASVDNRPFEMSHEFRGKMATDPIIHFTDGSSIAFITVENGTGEYGHEISYWPRPGSGSEPETTLSPRASPAMD